MTAKEFLKLGKRDFDNGAVRDEICTALRRKEMLEGFLKRIEADPDLPLQIKNKYFVRCVVTK
jgi:hypothetical protein